MITFARGWEENDESKFLIFPCKITICQPCHVIANGGISYTFPILSLFSA